MSNERTRNTYAHCYWCNATITELSEMRNSRGRRVVFCSQKHFRRYIAANPPHPPSLRHDSHTSPVETINRMTERLDDLRAESLFLPDTSMQKLVDESIIHELTSIAEGRERVTIQERVCVRLGRGGIR
jgi:hypothetical protein